MADNINNVSKSFVAECFTLDDKKRNHSEKPCHFPFTYNGIKYEGCTDIDHDRLWCSTEVDENGDYNGKWGDCSKGCKFDFFTCWSRKNEEKTIKTLNIKKATFKKVQIPEEFDIKIEFFGYDKSFKCAGSERENVTYRNIWTEKDSGFVL